MKIFSWADIQNSLITGKQDDFFAPGTGISVGSFDGLHKGHRTLLSRLLQNSKADGLLSGVLTFARPLPSIKNNSNYSGDVTTLEQRLRLFEQLGLDFAIVVDFTKDFAELSGQEFLSILIKTCNLKLLAEGVDFRCGYKGSTDVAAIKVFAETNNLKVVFVEPVYYTILGKQERVSSSLVRQLIIQGETSVVEQLLERKYELDLPEALTTIQKSKINQVIPPAGSFCCKSKAGLPVTVQISEKNILLSSAAQKIFF